MNKIPLADTGDEREKEKLRSIISERGLVGAANNAKWNALIQLMRQRKDWRPSYRYKWVEGYISAWDVEWFYHLPFPFLGVEWFDLGLHQEIRERHLAQSRIIDHSEWILKALERIGFEHEVARDMVRIWGYLPRSYEDFPPSST